MTAPVLQGSQKWVFVVCLVMPSDIAADGPGRAIIGVARSARRHVGLKTGFRTESRAGFWQQRLQQPARTPLHADALARPEQARRRTSRHPGATPDRIS